MIPDIGDEIRAADIVSTNAMVWATTVYPPRATVSVATVPEAEPEPYEIPNAVELFLKVEDELVWNTVSDEQADEELAHEASATQKSEEPVSIATSNCCAGVPMDTLAEYEASLLWSARVTARRCAFLSLFSMLRSTPPYFESSLDFSRSSHAPSPSRFAR